MAYGDNTLGASHRWRLDGDLADSIGAVLLTGTDISTTTPAITRDSTNSASTTTTSARAEGAQADDMGALGFDRYAIQGWVMLTSIQGPPCCIYKQGGETAGLSVFLWAGNNVMLQALNPGWVAQIYSDIALTDNRPYHFFIRYSGNAYRNEVEFYIDGVKQTRTLSGSAPNASAMDIHTGAFSLGRPGSTGRDVPVGSSSVIVVGPVSCRYSQWWTWFGAAAEAITEQQISDDLFAAGAIPDVTIPSGDQLSMQATLDAYASTIRGDAPLCFLVEPVTGDGNLTLSADNITFNTRSSIHVRYEGTGTLTWVNNNGSNASRSSGNVVLSNPSLLTINNLRNPSEVRVFEAGTENELAGQENVTTGTWSSTISYPTVDISVLSLGYQMKRIKSISMASNVTLDAAQVVDRQYENA